MSEGGVYGQLLTYGAAIGWDSEAGITFSIFHSLSAGVSADVWASWSLSFSDFSVKYDGPSAYFGGGTPTGVPTIITLNVQNNLGSNNYAAQIGIGWNDYAEAGIYGESDFSKQIEYLLLGLKVTFDNYESLAKLFLDQDPQDSIYAHDSFMFATSLFSMGGLFDACVTYDQVEDLVNEAISLNVEGWNAAPHSEDDAISFLVDVFRLADFHEYM